jgi:Rab-GTPase-TBC domain
VGEDAIRRQAWPKLVGLHEQIWDVGYFGFTNQQQQQDHGQKKEKENHDSWNSMINKGNKTTTATATATTTATATAMRNKKKKNTIGTTKSTQNRNQQKNGDFHNSNYNHVDSMSNCISSNSHNKQNRLDLIHENNESNRNNCHTNIHFDDIDSNNYNDALTESQYSKNKVNTNISMTNNNNHSSHHDCEPTNKRQQFNGYGKNMNNASNNPTIQSMRIKSSDSFQIDLDCKRCTWHLLTGSQRSQQIQMEHKRNSQIAKLIKRKQIRLANLINYAVMKSYSIDGNCFDSTNQFSSTIATKGTLSSRTSELLLHQQQKLTYYQGYHDVACIILSTMSGSIPIKVSEKDSSILVDSATRTSVLTLEDICSSNNTSTVVLDEFAKSCGIDLPACVLYELSQSHFADCLKSDFWDLQTMLRLSIFPLMKHFDPIVHDHFMQCDMELPYFAIPWVITWFSHEIRDTELVKRIFDFFIVSHPIMPIYVSVAMILHPINREKILNTEYCFTSLHQILTSLPRNSSMVGWKYRPGDGYLSDDGQDHDDNVNSGGHDIDSETDDSISIDADSFVLINDAWTSLLNDDAEKNNSEAVSVVSSSLSSIVGTAVPFQELIDMAIHYMEQIPPRKLLQLATQQYTCHELFEIVQPILKHSLSEKIPSAEMISKDPLGVITNATVSIRMLRPPIWSRVSKCPSNDKMLQQKACNERCDQNPRSTSDRIETSMLRLRKVPLSKQGNGYMRLNCDRMSNDVVDNDEGLEIYLEANSSLARIAAGFGSCDDINKSRISIQRNKVVIGITIAVVVVAIVVSIVVQNEKHCSNIKPNSAHLEDLWHEVSMDDINSRAPDYSSKLMLYADDNFMTQDSPIMNTNVEHCSRPKHYSVELNQIIDSTANRMTMHEPVIGRETEFSATDSIRLPLKNTLTDADSELVRHDDEIKRLASNVAATCHFRTQPNVLNNDEISKNLDRLDHVVIIKPPTNSKSLLDIVALRPLIAFFKSAQHHIHASCGLNFSKRIQQHLQENDRLSRGLSTSSRDNYGKETVGKNDVSLSDSRNSFADSPISLIFRDLIKHITTNKLVKTISQINLSQVSLFVKNALHGAMVQSMKGKDKNATQHRACL